MCHSPVRWFHVCVERVATGETNVGIRINQIIELKEKETDETNLFNEQETHSSLFI